ncbi:MAG: aldolase catalytic domain-containing protein, partial [Treponema sp.]|nr:aldolase catalytic domain-containing protein [Treponema sp.]
MKNAAKTFLLDCTLRDGGYVNDWLFGRDNMVSVFERVVDAGTDFIEIGFLDERRPFDIDRAIMPDTQSVQKIFGALDKKKSKVLGMIDYGTCPLKNIQPKSQSFLDGIRVIFKKHLRKEALDFCGQLKDLGYMVFAQLVSVTSYSDEEMKDLIALANKAKPFAVSMVDTYGLMHQNNLSHYFDLLDGALDKDIALGYHGHNNFQMAYANCIAMLSKESDRALLVDGTLYGMGKSAGNAPIELVAMMMNHSLGKDYHISQYLEAIDANISQFYKASTWGYNMFYYLAASNDCHPNYVKDLMEKRSLSVKQINELLGKLEGEKKLLYDKKYMEDIYLNFIDKEVNDTKDRNLLQAAFAQKEILIAGPGRSMKSQSKKIQAFASERKPLTISINYIPSAIKADYVFLSNSKRYVQLAGALTSSDCKIIATSNVTAAAKPFDFVLNVSALLDRSAEIIDNSLVMLLKALCSMNVKKVTLA